MKVHTLAGLILLLTPCHSQSDGNKRNTDTLPNPTQKYPHVAELDERGKYFLYWTFNDDRITFEVHVRTHGWVGLGFTDNGRMAGADMVIGWINNGEAYFKDRHGIDNSLPPVDDQQDYKVHAALERDNFTIFKFSRQLNTCDEDDYDIHSGTVRVIYAWNEEDPEHEDFITYHRATRGVRSVAFLDHSQPEINEDREQWRSFDVMQNNVSVPEEVTYYHCHAVKIPKLDKKHHIVKFEPIIQEENMGVVHHIVLHQCLDDNIIPKQNGYSCQPGTMSRLETNCDSMVFGWAIGQEAFNVPEQAGMPIGSLGDSTYFEIETHYDNPLKLSDIVDSSGIRLYYTDHLREHDGGALLLGNSVTYPPMVIPPGVDRMRMDSFCSANCSESFIPPEGIHVFASFLHTHLVGVAAWTKHIRDGIELPEIIRDDHFDFNYQTQRTLSTPVHILPGDEMITTCVYSTPGKSVPVYGGVDTDSEMCMNFLLYYPRIDLQSCLSHVQDQNSMFELVKKRAEKGDFGEDEDIISRYTYYYMYKMKWDDEAREYIQNQIDHATEYDQFCIKHGELAFGDEDKITRAERIQIMKSLVQNDTCSLYLADENGSRGYIVDHVTIFMMIFMNISYMIIQRN